MLMFLVVIVFVFFFVLLEIVRSVFEANGLPPTDTREFKPHLTLAKVSKATRRGVRRIDSSAYAEHCETDFGTETVKGLELLSMTEPIDEDGYYHCFQRHLFSDL